MAERKNMILVEMACCLLHAKDLLSKFWVEAIYSENYLLNLVLTRFVSYVILVKKWCGKKPSIGYLINFRCIAWEHILDACRNELDAKIHAWNMMGYSKQSKSYQLFDLVKQ